MNSLEKGMVKGASPWCLLVAATLTLNSIEAGAPCERGVTWWNRDLGSCIPCTQCDPTQGQAVKIPCELHRDTVCHSINDLNIWPISKQSIKNNPRKHDVSDYEYYDNIDYDDEVIVEDDGGRKWDLEMSTLIVALCGCVVFFGVVLTLSVYQTKQWRALKQALKSDVRDLSAKLRLIESGPELKTQVVPSDHHIYCNIHVPKDAFLCPSIVKGLGNLYTEEKQPV